MPDQLIREELDVFLTWKKMGDGAVCMIIKIAHGIELSLDLIFAN